MKRIIVGADGSSGSANAMRWAAHIAASYAAEIVVMTGFVPTESELPPRRVKTLLADRERQVETWSLPARLGDLEVRTVVERGDPRDGILRVAQREHADLIVVGRVGQSAGPGLLHIGSMAEWLAHNADLPIAIVGGAVNVATRSVLVGVDGSAGSKAALDWVADLAKAVDLRVIAAAVHQPYVEWTPSTHADNWRRDIERQIREEFADNLTMANIEFEELALRGSNVADVLLQAAQDERTDVIVVGARGLGGFAGLRVGGVALKTLHRADRPVVIVPPPR
jgi:nucleotide-binding universal stress UspA family protein